MSSENASPDRSIEVKGNAEGSTLITGDGNTINIVEATGQGAHYPQTPPYYYPEPFSGSIFVGRDRELEQLHKLLQRSERVAIAAVGMGGIGKTTLARWYVKQHQADYPGGIWWLPVSQLVTQVLSYAGRSLGLEELPPEWSNAQIVQHYLSRWETQWPGRKLLVLDDVGEYKHIKGCLPEQGSYQVLMTTRVRMQSPVQRLQLGVLTPAAALNLLHELLGDDPRLEQEAAVAAELCEWLGYLPLGIELVGRYLSESSAPLSSVLGQLQRRALSARSIATVADEMDYEHNIEAALELSWQQLDEESQTVALLLGVFALAPISADWVIASLPDWDDADVLDCLDRQLVKRSLVNQREQGYELHGLVREFLQAKLASPDWTEQSSLLPQGFAEAMTAMAKTIPQTPTLGDRARVVSAVPHLEAVASDWTVVLGESDKTWCLIGLARFYESLSRWREAERCRQRALEISKTELGDRHPSTAQSLNNLAALYRAQGRYAEAEPLYVESLEIRKTELGERHPDTALSLNNLALLYRTQGRYSEAEPLYVESLEIYKTELGERHPDTARSLNNLALLYYSQGRYSEAEPLLVEALEIYKTELGERHPSTALSLNNLAELYRTQGRYSEAEPLYVEALEISKTELGERHPDTALSLNNLAALYESQGRYSEAEPLYVESLEIYKTELGERHPDTATSLNNLAALYESQGRYADAEPLYVEALEIYKTELGERHPSTAQSLNNLAELYRTQGRYSEAEPLYVEALEISKTELGERHPDTATSLNNLALLYDSQGRYSEAEPLYVEALEIRKTELGERHPDTANSLNNLALLYKSQGRYSEAEPLYVESLEIRKTELGERHPSTARSLFNLAALYHQMHQSPKALPLIEQALAIYIPVLGAEHPETKAATSWLQTIQQAQDETT